jgi:hypothetical protein
MTSATASSPILLPPPAGGYVDRILKGEKPADVAPVSSCRPTAKWTKVDHHQPWSTACPNRPRTPPLPLLPRIK